MLYINLQLVWSLFFQEFRVILFNYHRAIDHSLCFHPQTISLQQVVVLTVIQMLACNTKQLHKMLCELQWYFANTLNILQEKRSLLAGMHILKKKEKQSLVTAPRHSKTPALVRYIALHLGWRLFYNPIFMQGTRNFLEIGHVSRVSPWYLSYSN